MSHHNPHWQAAQTNGKYLVSVDVGTTSVRCLIYDEQGRELSSSMSKVFAYFVYQFFLNNLGIDFS